MKESQRLADARALVERLEREEAHTFITIKEKIALQAELRFICKALSDIARTIVVPDRSNAVRDMERIINRAQYPGAKSLADIGSHDFSEPVDDTLPPSLHELLRMCPEERKVWIERAGARL